MKTIESLNIATSSTTVYKGRPSWDFSARGALVYRISWTITGTVTGTLKFETSDSISELLGNDVGNVGGQTDAAKWFTIQPVYDATDTVVAGGTIAITNTTSDYIDIDGQFGRAVRATYTNATGTATVVVTITARDA